MKIASKSEILELLSMPYTEFCKTVMKEAKEIYRSNGNVLKASGMLGYSNVCKNHCLYCGMSAGCKIPRYRVEPEEAIQSMEAAKESGLRRIFLISGEDPNYQFEKILEMVRGAKKLGMHVSLATGEFEREQYKQLRDAGADRYVMKFEMSDRETFNRLNPSTDFDSRMKCIEWIKELGFELGSGNIVDYPGHTPEQIADDILLMRELEIDWAPVVPYMPAPGTPLAKEGGRGSLETNLREISILRIMMPDIDITAQQPGENPEDGLTAIDGNLNALNAGANLLFADLLQETLAKNFSVIGERKVKGVEHIRKMAELAGMPCEV